MIWKMTKLMEIEEIMLCNLVLLKIPKQPCKRRLCPVGAKPSGTLTLEEQKLYCPV